MILYYAPGACSQAAHIILHEIGLQHDSARVNLKSKTLDDGSSYLAVNPKGAVPALKLDSEDILTENAVILQFLGDRSGSDDLFPALGDFRRYRVLEKLNFIATELHKGFAPLFKPGISDGTRQFVLANVATKLDYIDGVLNAGPYLMADRFTIADAYLFVMTSWSKGTGLVLDRWPNLLAFRNRMLERPAVQQVLEFEGLAETEAAG